MRKTSGDSFGQDMDLVLERQIDLTDPKDGPWLEADGKDRPNAPMRTAEGGVTEPAVITKKGLSYRETRSSSGSQISLLVQFRHPGDFYLMELDYPDDAERHMGVSCCPAYWGLSNEGTYSKTSAAVTTGYRYPLTGRMQTLQWLYRPNPGNHAINLINLWSGAPAAGAKLRYYHIRNGLPALDAPDVHTRWNGHGTERTTEKRFRIQWERLPEDLRELSQSQRGDVKANPVTELCRILEEQVDAAQAYAQYMRFTGNNMHIMGCYQYTETNTPFLPDWPFACWRVKPCMKEVLARVLNEYNIDFFAGVEYVCSAPILEYAEAQARKPERGFWDTVYLVDKDGNEYMDWNGRYGLNFNHPMVRREMARIADELCRKFRTLPNFRGITWRNYLGGDWLPSYRTRRHTALDTGYGDVTIRKFEKDTGWKVPVSEEDPNRFAKRYACLLSGAWREKWLSWRARTMAEFYRDLADTTRKWRKDLDCVCDLYLNPVHDREWQQSGKTFREYMVENGWDSAFFREKPGLWLCHMMYGRLNKRVNNLRYGLGWEMSSHPERFQFFGSEKNRAVHVKDDWHEMEQYSWALPYREDWPRYFQPTLLEQPGGYNTLEVFARGLIGADAQLFFYGFADATLFEGNEQPLREFNRVLRRLPSERFQPVAGTGLGTNLAIRELCKDGACYFYAVNPGYWPVSGSVTLKQAGEVMDLVTGKGVATPQGDTTIVRIELKPFCVAAFKTASDGAKIVGWEASARPGAETKHLEALLDEAEGLFRSPGARVVLTPDDERYMRTTLAGTRREISSGNHAAALLTMSEDRFWTLKTEYMEKGVKYGTERTRSPEATTERRSGRAVRVAKPPVIDGKLDDPAWQSVPACAGFVTADGRSGMAGASFRAVHDGENLYLAVECRDSNPGEIRRKAVRENEGTVFQDDYVAFFLQPDTSRPKYFQMAVSAGGVLFDQKVVGGDRDYRFAPAWEAKTAITPEGWTAEVRLPAESLEGAIGTSATWGFNIYRGFRDRVIPETSWSFSPLTWHDPGRFGLLKFE